MLTSYPGSPPSMYNSDVWGPVGTTESAICSDSYKTNYRENKSQDFLVSTGNSFVDYYLRGDCTLSKLQAVCPVLILLLTQKEDKRTVT